MITTDTFFAGKYRLKCLGDDEWRVSVRTRLPYLYKATWRELGVFEIPLDKIHKWQRKPHSGAVETSIRAFLKQKQN